MLSFDLQPFEHQHQGQHSFKQQAHEHALRSLWLDHPYFQALLTLLPFPLLLSLLHFACTQYLISLLLQLPFLKASLDILYRCQQFL